MKFNTLCFSLLIRVHNNKEGMLMLRFLKKNTAQYDWFLHIWTKKSPGHSKKLHILKYFFSICSVYNFVLFMQNDLVFFASYEISNRFSFSSRLVYHKSWMQQARPLSVYSIPGYLLQTFSPKRKIPWSTGRLQKFQWGQPDENRQKTETKGSWKLSW